MTMEPKTLARTYLRETRLPAAPAALAAAIRAGTIAVVWVEADGSGERPATPDETHAYVKELVGSKPWLQQWLRTQGVLTGWHEVVAALDTLADAGPRTQIRIGTAAVGAYMANGATLTKAVRALRKAGRITHAEMQPFKAFRDLCPLEGEEFLAAAGLLALAHAAGELTDYPPAVARTIVAGATKETRIRIDPTGAAALCQVLGYEVGDDGRVPAGDRAQIEDALRTLTTVPRPIVVKVREKVGREWRDGWELSLDIPVKLSVRDDGTRCMDLHPSLALGHWHGHLSLDGLPVQWTTARKQIGAKKTATSMRRADIYFRWLAAGIASEHARTGAEGVMAKTLMTTTLLEKLALLTYRAEQGPKRTTDQLHRALDFCVATGSLVAWECLNPDQYRVQLPALESAEAEPET